MSLKGDKYETAEEAQFRLNDTIVLYDKKPVYITQVIVPENGAEDNKEVARVYFKELPLNPNQKNVRKYLSSRNFDLSIPNLGYFNHQGSAFFASRSPLRQNQQGLSSKTLKVRIADKSGADIPSFETIIHSQSFVDMITGVYPSFTEACDLFDTHEDVHSMALSPSFAVFLDIDLDALLLAHRGITCGILFKDERILKMSPKFNFLKEEMFEAGLPVP